MRSVLASWLFYGALLIGLSFAAVYAASLTSIPRTPKAERTTLSAVEIEVDDGLGSGVEVRPGYIITANHVVDGATTINIIRQDGTEVFNAKVLWQDKKHDLAAVGIPAEFSVGTSPLACGYAGVIGDHIEVVGNPVGIRFAHTWGRVAATQSSFSMANPPPSVKAALESWPSLFLADASIAPGNSGGPVYDDAGRVVGIAVGLIVVPLGLASGTFAGLSYIVPAKTVCEDIKAHDKK